MGYKQHTDALKWLRERHEDPVDAWQSPVVHLEPQTAVAVVVHNKGPTWSYKDEQVQWSWLEMVAQLDTTSMELAVNGPNGRSGGLVGCSFALRPNSYDHVRQQMPVDQYQKPVADPVAPSLSRDPPPTGTKLPIWDFVLHRADGSGLRLHPDHSRTKFGIFELDGHSDPVHPPPEGPGRSRGPGTFRYFKEVGVQGHMRFDASKKPR